MAGGELVATGMEKPGAVAVPLEERARRAQACLDAFMDGRAPLAPPAGRVQVLAQVPPAREKHLTVLWNDQHVSDLFAGTTWSELPILFK